MTTTRTIVQKREAYCSSDVLNSEVLPKLSWNFGTIVNVPAGVTTISVYTASTNAVDENFAEIELPTLLYQQNPDGTYSPCTFTVVAGKSYELPMATASIAYICFVTNIDCTLVLTVI